MNYTRTNFFKIFLTIAALFSFAYNVSAQNSWSVKPEPQKVFIENKGQFHIHKSEEPVLFAFDGAPTSIYFTKKGISYSFLKRWAKEKDKNSLPQKFTSVQDWKKKEAEEHELLYESDAVFMTWENANPDVEVLAYEATSDYHSYCVKNKEGKIENINHIKAFKKIIYKNIYPNIDIEFVFHPSDGLKYSIILHPGADISKVRMSYSTTPKINSKGDVHISTKFGDIIDHAPSTFYSANKTNIINSYFIKDGNTISFKLDTYDVNKTIIIDPWTQTPSLPSSNGVWECERDGNGNVYIIGGESPMTLMKFNSTGTLQWTYYTPFDTANNWLGTFITDLAGNSFVTSGSIASLQKINTTGGLEWNAPSPVFNTDEYWNIAFNCDQTKMIIGGTTGNMTLLEGAIFDINTSDGSVNSVKVVGAGFMYSIPPIIEEVRSITSCRNSRYYFLTLDTIGAIDDNFSVCPSGSPTVFRINNGYSLAYKCENYRPNNGNSGIMSIRANRYFVYSQNGTTVHQRSLIDGSIIASATIPGGLSTTSLGRYQVGNSGLDIDSCGNVYVGSGDGVYKYDANLNLLSQVNTTYKVFDVNVSSGGNVIFCGATGDLNTNGNRNGTIQQANMSACPPMTLFCCDANICPVSPICNTASPVTLTAGTTGGTWSGPGVNPSTGVFDPGTAGPGTHIITYTLPCGESSIAITVNACATLYVCQDIDGNFVVSGGTGPYSWQTSQTALDCSACPLGQCMPPICNGTMVTTWTTFATGNTASYPGVVPFRVVDINNNEFTVNDTSLVSSCGSCPHFTFNITNVVNVCPGQTNGGFTVATSGGASPYDYYLKNSGGSIIASYMNVSGSQTFTGLAAGTYNLIATDNDTCSDSTLVTINQPTEMTITLAPQDEHCPNSCDGSVTALVTGGSTPYTYAWSSAQNTATINGICAGTYSVTVTDDNTCTKTASTTVGTSIAVSADFTANPQSGSIPLTVQFTYTGNGAISWAWDFGDGSVSGDQYPAPHIYDSLGTYTVTLFISSGPPDFCIDSFQLVIDVENPSWLIVPNIFTPNGDGKNDIFQVQAEQLKTIEVSVFNRWGKEIFSTEITDPVYQDNNKIDIWDGKTKGGSIAADGVYYFVLKAIGTDDVEYDLNGTVTLLK